MIFGGEAVTTEPTQKGSILFNEVLSCFSETTDQDCKDKGMHVGENFGLQLLPEPKSPHPH